MTVIAMSGAPSISLRPGISFARASKSYSPLTISAVAKDGVFGRSPLVPGMVVLTINGQEATWMHPDDAKSLVKSGEPISITVEAFIAKIVRKTRLEKLGIVLKESKGEKGLLIEEIWQESPFANTDLKQGMKIVNINGSRCPNRPKEALRLMQKIFGTMKIIAVQTNRDATAEKNQDAEVAMNWTLSHDSADSKRETQAKRKEELKRKLSKEADKFSNGLDKLESSLTRLESSVKESTGIVRSRTEKLETSLEPQMMDRSASDGVKPNQATKSKDKSEMQTSEGYTLRRTGSYICDLDECSGEVESEKNSSKLFNFQQSPASAVSQLRKIGRKKKQTVVATDADTAYDADDATRVSSATSASKYFNFDMSPSEAMAKLKKTRKKNKTPTSKGRRRRKKEKSTTAEEAKAPQRPRAVDFAGQVRKVSKKARDKLQSSLASSTKQEVADADDSLVATGTTADAKQPRRSSFMSRVSPSKAVALTKKMSFGRQAEQKKYDDEDQTKQNQTNQEKEKELSRQLKEVQVIGDEMGLEICITELPVGGHDSNGDISLEDIVIVDESSNNIVGASDPVETANTAERDSAGNLWPSQQVKTYDDTILDFAGMRLADPKRATSPRNIKEAAQSEVSEPASKTVVMHFDDIPKEEQPIDVAVTSNIKKAPSQEEESLESYFSGSDGEYSNEFESDSEYDSDDDDDYSGSEGDWSEDSRESVDENAEGQNGALHLQHSVTEDEESQQGMETRDVHQLPSRPEFGDTKTGSEHIGGAREAVHPTGALSTPVETMDSSDASEHDFQVVAVSITKASRDAVLGFKVFQYEDRDGIFISEIDEYSGLLHSGLKPGMQVKKVNGKKCPNNFSEGVALLKNTIGVVKIEAIAGDWGNPPKIKKSISSASQVPAASSFIESQLSNIFSGVLSLEDSPELIVKMC
ncbi:MAG: hypothetical protein SGBAC_006362 [Bacillariaceae sp.]